MTDYTRDLNEIVEVVREWCEVHMPRWRRYTLFLDDKHPALALSIAFARVARLKGWWINE